MPRPATCTPDPLSHASERAHWLDGFDALAGRHKAAIGLIGDASPIQRSVTTSNCRLLTWASTIGLRFRYLPPDDLL